MFKQTIKRHHTLEDAAVDTVFQAKCSDECHLHIVATADMCVSPQEAHAGDITSFSSSGRKPRRNR